MKRIGIVGVLLGALALSACTQDIVIRNSSGVTVVGEVTGEYLNSRVDVGTDGMQLASIGVFSTQTILQPFKTAWGEYEGTELIEVPFEAKVSTGVTYIGTKGNATLVIDTRTIACPKGFMVGTCLSAIEDNQNEIVKLYKEKFSYLK